MADAWSITMREGQDAENTKSDDDDKVPADMKQPDNNTEELASSLSLLIERVDHIEEQAKISESVIEDLQTRLVKAELRIAPHDSHAHPWRRIIGRTKSSKKNRVRGGDEGVDTEEGKMEEAAEDEQCQEELKDRDIKPSEEYQIPQDIYSVVSAWKRNSRPFWIAMTVIFVQLVLLSLLLVDQIGTAGTSDILVFPANVPRIVHASQALATIIAIFDQDDLRSAIENFFDGLPTRFRGDETFQHMTKTQWNFSCFIRFLQGFLSVFASFILAVQATTVFDVLLNFLGVKFVSELDDLSFALARIGYFGPECERATKSISEVTFQQDNHNKVDSEEDFTISWFVKYAHVIGVFGILAFLMGIFLYVLISQSIGNLAPEFVSVNADEGDLAFAALFRGCYRVNKDNPFSLRMSYEQMGFLESGGKFAFCNDIPGDGESAWVFVVGDLTEPCEQYVGRTEASDSFNILDTGNLQWYSSEGKIYGNVEVSKISESSPDCIQEQVNRTKKTCEQLDVTGYVGTNQQEVPLKSFKKTYVDSTGYTVYTYPPLTHPIFVESASTPSKYELILYTGQSWVLTDVLQSKTTGDDVSMQDYMDTDPEFRSILLDIIFLGQNVHLVTGSVNTDAGISYDPLGLRWFRMREAEVGQLHNYPTADESRPVDEILVSCGTCDDSDTPCSFGGICLEDRTCKCINGGFGALCQNPPTGDGKCDPYFNSKLYDWDGGDCCGGTCVGPICGLGGLPAPFGITDDQLLADPFSAVGYQGCEDPSMAPLTIELKDFALFDIEGWYVVVGEEDGDPFCTTATINIRCGGVTYLHFPQYTFHNPSDCARTLTETINVPYGSQCELSSNIGCFGPYCLNHTVSVYYGNDTSASPIRSGNVGRETRLSFGVPTECITETLGKYSTSMFDLSTDEGMAASFLSNDGVSEYICAQNPDYLLERYALTMLNASVHLNSSNWDPFQCHGWGIPAVTTVCTNFSVTSLILEMGATMQVGTMPTELALLTNLRELSFPENNFTGVVPTQLGMLRALERIELWGNYLTGTIPSEIGFLTRLWALALSDNQLTGTIPTEIAKLLSLTGIFLDDNFLTGSIPSEFGAMPSLLTMSLQDNYFSGTLPTELGRAQSLQTLFLYKNRNLTGTIPSELGNLNNLFSLAIVATNVTGTIPTELGLLSSLVSLELWANQLSGTIPTTLGSLSALEALALSVNGITGTIPTELGLLSDNLNEMHLNDNNLTGVIPTEFGLLSANLQEMELQNNALGGELPSELFALQNLLECNLENNQFSGGTAPDICNV